MMHDIENSSGNNSNNSNSKRGEELGLLSFEADVMIIILSQFLTVYDVVKLDTAYCNKMQRAQLLSILSLKSIVYKHIHFSDSFTYIDKFMQWIGKRTIGLAGLSIEYKREYSKIFIPFGDTVDNHIKLSYLSDEGLVWLSHCTSLQSLDVSWCKNIHDISIVQIGRHCSNLKELDISFCTNITDISLVEIGR